MGRGKRIRQSPQHKPVDPELVKKAEELGVPEIVNATAPEKKVKTEEPIRVFASEIEQRLNNPQKHDIIQIVAKPNEYWARIGIVHEVKPDGTLICYQPGKGGYPNQFRTRVESVAVVGQAKLKYNQDKLPEQSVYSDEAARLDQI